MQFDFYRNFFHHILRQNGSLSRSALYLLPFLYIFPKPVVISALRQLLLTFEPVQAATTSCIVHGVTITIKPNDIAAIVRDADPLNRRSCATIWNNGWGNKKIITSLYLHHHVVYDVCLQCRHTDARSRLPVCLVCSFSLWNAKRN